jgi:hypothetical protein
MKIPLEINVTARTIPAVRNGPAQDYPLGRLIEARPARRPTIEPEGMKIPILCHNG